MTEGPPLAPSATQDELARDFELYVRARGPGLARVARLLCDDAHTAEDLVQTVLAKALVSWRRVGASGDIDAYLRRALVNTRNSWWRRLRKEHSTDRVPDGVMADSTSRSPEYHLLLDALRTLPRGQRAAVVLRYYEDLSESQVAAILGCSIGTVRSQTGRGLRALRLSLGAPSAPTRPASATADDALHSARGAQS